MSSPVMTPISNGRLRHFRRLDRFVHGPSARNDRNTPNDNNCGRKAMARAIIGLTAAFVFAAALPAAAQHTSGPRVPLVQDDSTDPDVQATFKDLKERGTTPLNLHRIYANAPKIARAQSALAKALRTDAIVPRADRELIIL